MNRAQERALSTIRAQIRREYECINHEIKKWDVTETEYFVSLVVTIGVKGDEGTLGEVFGRDHMQLFIGKRGGVKYPVTKATKSGDMKFYYKPFKGVLRAVIDQRVD